MLPLVAMLVAGVLSKQGAAVRAPSGGTDAADILGGLLGGGPGQPRGSANLGSMLDLDGDGNPLDDIIGMAGKLLR
jgi:hypothetical protein